MTDHNEHEHDEDAGFADNASASADSSISSSSLILSESAVAAARQYRIDRPEWGATPLRVYLAGKGCDGFEYGVCFDQRDPGDHFFSQESIDLVCDTETFKFIAGATIDFVDDDRGRGFIVENPRHKQFRGKFYKRKGWEERLKN